MKIWLTLITLVSMALAPTTRADDAEKLDLILKELRDLKERVVQLEATVAKLSGPSKAKVEIIEIQPGQSSMWRARGISRDPAFHHPLPSKMVEDVFRLQIESPGTLLKGIHERERELRSRVFPPES